LYAPASNNKEKPDSNSKITTLITKGAAKKIIRKKSEQISNQPSELKKDEILNIDNKNVELPVLEKSHSDFEVANLALQNNNTISNIFKEKTQNIENTESKQYIENNPVEKNKKIIKNPQQNKENTNSFGYDYEYSMNRGTSDNFQSAEFINVYPINHNNQSNTGYVPKRIIKKQAPNINEAFKTRPDNIKLKQEVQIISNESNNGVKNVSAYSQSRIFQNEKLKRNQVYYYSYNYIAHETHPIKSNPNLIFKTKNLENI
jgi:hypothetical protein